MHPRCNPKCRRSAVWRAWAWAWAWGVGRGAWGVPLPDGPTRAHEVPAGMVRLKPLQMWKAGAEG